MSGQTGGRRRQVTRDRPARTPSSAAAGLAATAGVPSGPPHAAVAALGASGRLREAYDRIAPAFAVRNASVPPEYAGALGPRFLRLVGSVWRAEGRPPVIDVGCGAGRDMAWLEARGAGVTGVDLSPGMLAQARLVAAGGLLQMDMRRLAFRDGSFAGAWCSASLLHLPKSDAPAVLTELRRVLVPGGALMVALQRGEGEGWEASAAGLYGQSVERFFARYRDEEAGALLAGSGFTVRWRLHDAFAPGGARGWLRFLVTSG